MDTMADHLDQASDALAALSRDIPTLTVAPGAFAALPALSATRAASASGAAGGAHPGSDATPPSSAAHSAPPALSAAHSARPTSSAADSARAAAGVAMSTGSGIDRSAVPTHSSSIGAGAADGSGLPGSMGRALHDHWAAVLDARSREASSAAARLGQLARAVRSTRQHYAETDEAVGRRFDQEL
ncbi:hypothetical protein [Paractinoplanes maris]|uniref:hypothetical protein n=1 Tax=Paractinoplanes maris TaxID=1734446 RepID=UPI0020210D26|nr:hypothetical protein [Actinoplanes maris]